MSYSSDSLYRVGDRVTPIRDIILGPKRRELCIVTMAGYSRIQIKLDREGSMKVYNLSSSMVRKTSALELLAECLDDEV